MLRTGVNNFWNIKETDDISVKVYTLRFGDEVFVHDIINDPANQFLDRNFQKTPSSRAEKLYCIRVNRTVYDVDYYTDFEDALRMCNSMNNNRWYMNTMINPERRRKQLLPFSEKRKFHVAIMWDEWSTGYTMIKKKEEKKRKETKQKKALERMLHPPKRKRGRPKGSKNKPKDPNAPPKPKRKRGRPKGSKNKPKPKVW